MYVPDPATLMQDYAELKRQAEALAVVRGCRDRPGVSDAPPSDVQKQWRVAHVDSKRFGDVVAHGELTDASKNVFLEYGGVEKRLHVLGNDIVTLELVSDFDTWKEAKRPGLPGRAIGD